MAAPPRLLQTAPVTGFGPEVEARWRPARAISWVVVPLMVVASAAGLLVGDVYREPVPVAALLRGNDLVTLVVAAPLLAAALLAARRGSARAQLVWAAMLAYTVYTYATVVFGTTFNALFLVHVALFSLAVFALVAVLSRLG
ncbi:MAG: hypothetical protein ACLGIA_02585 [Actinomycetes bacterium]